MSIQKRLLQLRIRIGVNQTEFAKKIGIPQTTYSSYEGGRRRIPEHLMVSICMIYGVSEEWLRTGQGEMFAKKTEDEELAEYFGEILSKESDPFIKRIFYALSKLDEKDWDVFEKFLKNLTESGFVNSFNNVSENEKEKDGSEN